MSNIPLYPSSPDNVPESLTRAKISYKRQAWLAMIGLTVFMLFYLSLAACFGWIVYVNIIEMIDGNITFANILVTLISSLLTIFMAKSLFSVRKSGNVRGVEVTPKQEPKLFDFLHTLADEIGAPRPHRVFITADVNAAVFYDLSLINMFFPSKKNLIIGLGLVNVVNLGELKAILAHEFGHFSQGSMMVGRWVYIAQQIIGHMVVTRDWLDSAVRFISKIDIRIAWLGWLLGLVIWSIRSLMDSLFRLVVIAERALSREMEFNADLVAVSVTGSDALINALYKLQSADAAWQATIDVVNIEVRKGNLINDLFSAQKSAIKSLALVLNDDGFGVVPEAEGDNVSQHRIFSKNMARPPQMWSTHPQNSDREDNAKKVYISSNIDQRESWLVFSDPKQLRQTVSHSFYHSDNITQMTVVSAEQVVSQSYSQASYLPKYRGTYLNRSPVRLFNNVDEILNTANLTVPPNESILSLYPESLTEHLKLARNLDLERSTLKDLASGKFKPSGGVIRHRGNELNKADIPDAIQEIEIERAAVADILKVHDASCRVAHLQAAKECSEGWESYLKSLLQLLHCSEHLQAKVNNELALLVNTWQVITADKKIGYFEKRRIIKVCEHAQKELRQISSCAGKIVLPDAVISATGYDDWANKYPNFSMLNVSKKNWKSWCESASKQMNNLIYTLGAIKSATLEELIISEDKVAQQLLCSIELDAAPIAGNSPTEYPTLLIGDEHKLQRKLDLWNRFQLAHGFFPSTLRLIVSLGVVAGTVYIGLIRA
ncbi:M48 family metallopeptidase [uncultured Psychrosphaera sp.]|uniref:M48 family metallopeptidase n=1 Tax=uncultured Psychrosphaera sp. TaxID=1403522 RepID=UPI00262DC7E1|nr:M48 family metallopeptidase [uncultured Psychrosphaera sp.]